MVRVVHNMLAEIGSPWNQFRLVVAADFGVSLRRAGYREEGAAEGEQVLKLYASVLGPDNRDSLRSAVNIMNDRRITGDLSGAQELGERTVESWEKVAGPEHPNTVKRGPHIRHGRRRTGVRLGAESGQGGGHERRSVYLRDPGRAPLPEQGAPACLASC
jgi:hypothetical protein